jgi:hypothetical protein
MSTAENAPPGLRELIGAAVGACHGTAIALERAAALGAATLILPDAPLESPNPAAWHKDRRLAGVLWRIRGGHQVARREAAILFARRLRGHHLFKNFAPADDLLLAFSLAMIIEWDNSRCRGCGGTMLANPDPDDSARNLHRTKRCEDCKQHPGRAATDHTWRARALGVPQSVYDKHWPERFARAHALLAAIEPKIESPLRKQTSKRSIAAT